VSLVFPGVALASGGCETTNGAGELVELRRRLIVIRSLDRLLGKEAIGEDAGDEGNDEVVRPRGVAAEDLVSESLEIG
jgi:hypothetical protein